MTNNTEELPTTNEQQPEQNAEQEQNEINNGQLDNESNEQQQQQQQQESAGAVEQENVENGVQQQEIMEVDDQQPAADNDNNAEIAEAGAVAAAVEIENQPANNDAPDSDAEGDGNAPAANNEPFYGFDDSEPNFEEKDMSQVLQYWETKHTQSGYDPVAALKR